MSKRTTTQQEETSTPAASTLSLTDAIVQERNNTQTISSTEYSAVVEDIEKTHFMLCVFHVVCA